MVPPGSGADPCCSETVDQGGPRREGRVTENMNLILRYSSGTVQQGASPGKYFGSWKE